MKLDVTALTDITGTNSQRNVLRRTNVDAPMKTNTSKKAIQIRLIVHCEYARAFVVGVWGRGMGDSVRNCPFRSSKRDWALVYLLFKLRHIKKLIPSPERSHEN